MIRQRQASSTVEAEASEVLKQARLEFLVSPREGPAVFHGDFDVGSKGF
jgi:hypothetical protein